MASTEKSGTLIKRMRSSEVCVPWCDEYEKMISGMNFKAANAQPMLEHKLTVRKRLKVLNDDSIPEHSTLDSLKAHRFSAAKRIFGKLGAGTNIEAPHFCTFGCNTFIGEGVYINRNVHIYDSSCVTIGDRTLIGPGVCICTDSHEVESADRLKSNNGSYAKAITIGEDCWICVNATILPGVSIGRGSTVAGGAMVTKDVEPFTLVGGVPARLIRKLKGPEPNA